MGNTNTVPLISQTKSLVQFVTGDKNGARDTQEKFLHECPIVAQATSIVELVADKNREKFKDTNLRTVRILSNVADGIPIVGHVKGAIHAAAGDFPGARNAIKSANRSVGVVSGGVVGFLTLGPLGAVAGGIAGGAALDGIQTGVESAVYREFRPNGSIAAVRRVVVHPSGGTVFDALALPIFDGLGGFSAGQLTAQIQSGIANALPPPDPSSTSSSASGHGTTVTTDGGASGGATTASGSAAPATQSTGTAAAQPAGSGAAPSSHGPSASSSSGGSATASSSSSSAVSSHGSGATSSAPATSSSSAPTAASSSSTAAAPSSTATSSGAASSTAPVTSSAAPGSTSAASTGSSTAAAGPAAQSSGVSAAPSSAPSSHGPSVASTSSTAPSSSSTAVSSQTSVAPAASSSAAPTAASSSASAAPSSSAGSAASTSATSSGSSAAGGSASTTGTGSSSAATSASSTSGTASSTAPVSSSSAAVPTTGSAAGTGSSTAAAAPAAQSTGSSVSTAPSSAATSSGASSTAPVASSSSAVPTGSSSAVGSSSSTGTASAAPAAQTAGTAAAPSSHGPSVASTSSSTPAVSSSSAGASAQGSASTGSAAPAASSQGATSAASGSTSVPASQSGMNAASTQGGSAASTANGSAAPAAPSTSPSVATGGNHSIIHHRPGSVIIADIKHLAADVRHALQQMDGLHVQHKIASDIVQSTLDPRGQIAVHIPDLLQPLLPILKWTTVSTNVQQLELIYGQLRVVYALVENFDATPEKYPKQIDSAAPDHSLAFKMILHEILRFIGSSQSRRRKILEKTEKLRDRVYSLVHSKEHDQDLSSLFEKREHTLHCVHWNMAGISAPLLEHLGLVWFLVLDSPDVLLLSQVEASDYLITGLTRILGYKFLKFPSSSIIDDPLPGSALLFRPRDNFVCTGAGSEGEITVMESSGFEIVWADFINLQTSKHFRLASLQYVDGPAQTVTDTMTALSADQSTFFACSSINPVSVDIQEAGFQLASSSSSNSSSSLKRFSNNLTQSMRRRKKHEEIDGGIMTMGGDSRHVRCHFPQHRMGRKRSPADPLFFPIPFSVGENVNPSRLRCTSKECFYGCS